MAGNYAQILPDSTGKKIETHQRWTDDGAVQRQIVTLGDSQEDRILETLNLILEELRESRRVLCEATRQNYEPLTNTPL